MSTYSLKQINEVLQNTNFYTDRVRYAFLKLVKEDFTRLLEKLSKYPDIYSEIINDKDELSLIIPKKIWDENFSSDFKALSSMGDVAFITCEVKQETVTGYLLAIVTMLSPHNISVFIQGAYTTDHIFVKYEQLDEALNLLNQLKG